MSHLHGCQHISHSLENLVLIQDALCCHISEQDLEGTSLHWQSLVACEIHADSTDSSQMSSRSAIKSDMWLGVALITEQPTEKKPQNSTAWT